MLYPYQSQIVSTSDGTVAVTALVPAVLHAIKTRTVIPYGDYGGPNVYYFDAPSNGLGNIIYTVFDRDTNLGLASYTVRYGAATSIYQVIFGSFPKCNIDIQHLVLPKIGRCGGGNHQGIVVP